MNYFSLYTTTEGNRLSGLSNLTTASLPPDSVLTDDLVLPTAAVSAGATNWELFNEYGFGAFYLYVGTPILQLRYLDYWYYTIPSNILIWQFNYGDTGSEFEPGGPQEVFLSIAYAGLEVTPLVVYSDSDNSIYEGTTYTTGQQLVIYDQPTPPVPVGFTTNTPIGGTSAYDTLQWNGLTWVSAPFPITLDLAGAQDYLTKLVQANATILINNQLSSYDTAQIAEAVDPELLEPRYKAVNLYPTIGDYRTAVGVETAPMFAFISAATAANQLYTFDPTVTEPAPYAP